MAVGKHRQRVHCLLAAGRGIGLGHLTRTVAVARELSVLGADVTLHLRHHPDDWPALEPLTAPLPVEVWDGETLPRGAHRAELLLLDYRSPLPPRFWQDAAQCRIVAGLDDPSPNRLHCSVLFYPPVPQLTQLDWTGFRGELRIGWSWVALGGGSVGAQLSPPRRTGPLRILLLTGGADPYGLAPPLLAALRRRLPEAEITAVVGPAAALEPSAVVAREPGPPVRLLQGVDPADMPRLMQDADAALSVYGVSALELAALAVPAVLVPLDADQQASAEVLARTRAALLAPLPDLEHPTEACEAAAELLAGLVHDRPRLQTMHRAAAALKLGHGAGNIARELIRLLHTQRKFYEQSEA